VEILFLEMVNNVIMAIKLAVVIVKSLWAIPALEL
jgi:hypothetical protein